MRFRFFLISLALALSLSAGAEGFVPALDTGTACDIHVYASYKNFESLEAEFDRFNEYYPDVSLDYTSLDDYNHTIGLALMSPESPDIYALSGWMIGREEYADAISAAENLLDSPVDLSAVNPRLLYTLENGDVPMAPLFTSCHGMLVNEDIFAALNLSVPQSYEDLISACEKLMEAGYVTPILGNTSNSGVYHALSFGSFHLSLKDKPEAVEALNALDPAAGEYLRPTLERVADFASHGFIDMEACAAMERDFSNPALRFFEGDVPMLFTTGDIVSGAKKRESLSEAFTAKPFSYHFYPIPLESDEPQLLLTSNMQLCVNRNSQNLEMANEFMRFLISVEELNEISGAKRLISSAEGAEYQGAYSPLNQIDPSRVMTEAEIGLLDRAIIQIRLSSWAVGTGTLSVDEAVAAYGSLDY